MATKLVTRFLSIVVVLMILSLSGVCQAGRINLANGKPIIGGNSDYPSGNFNTGGTYQTSNVTDGQNATPDNDWGIITEPFQDGSFWLARGGTTPGYFVLDLGSPQVIWDIVLFNTRNGPFDDRGTGQFTIEASNSVTDLGPSLGYDLVSPTVIVSGTLTPQTYPGAYGSQGSTPLVPDSFRVTNDGPFQYLRFNALTIGAALDKGYGAGGMGLNEIRVYGVPEPCSLLLLLIGSCTVGLLGWRKRAGSQAATLFLPRMGGRGPAHAPAAPKGRSRPPFLGIPRGSINAPLPD